MLLELVLIVVGFALLVVGADALVDGASHIATRLGLSERVVGLTVVAIGTSMPEIVVSITSAGSGYSDMAFGNVVGSCMANLLLILGLSAVIRPIRLGRATIRFEVPASVAAVVVLLVLVNANDYLTTLDGVILLALYAAFLAKTVHAGMQEDEGERVLAAHGVSADDTAALLMGDTDEDSHDDGNETFGFFGLHIPQNVGTSIFIIVAGIVMLKFGSDFVVDNATLMAEAIGVSERVIGLTVVALGTCLPELVTAVVAGLKGNTDLAVGNVLGSNVANVLLVMGIPALFSPIPYDKVYNIDFTLLVLASFALVGFAFIGTKRTMTRRDGVIFVCAYMVYLVGSALL